jgi:membrane-associated phospholipid phosphatase
MKRAAMSIAIAAAALVASLWLDAPIARLVSNHRFGYSYDLYSMFRLAGFIPVWVIVAAAFALIDARRGGVAARGGLLMGAVLISGGLAELMKIFVRRERPDVAALAYVFRPWHEAAWSSSGLGWPSSHSAVAFGAVWTLCRLYPAATPIWLLVGAGCGVSRLVGADHYVSDVVGGALVAWLVVAVLWRWKTRAA